LTKPIFKFIVRFVSICLCTLLWWSKANAQEYIFNRLDTKDGLASTLVYATWQDKKGYLWVGTENGLQRYDGYHFMSPYNASPEMLPNKAVHQILEDKKGRVWLRLGYEVYLFDPLTLRARKIPIRIDEALLYSASISIGIDAEGNAYFMHQFVTWYMYNEKTNFFEPDRIAKLVPAGYKIASLCDDSATHFLWIITDKGLLAYDRVRKDLYTPSHNPLHHLLVQDSSRLDYALQMMIDSKRRHWIYTWGGKKWMVYYCYDEKKNVYTQDTAGIWQNGRGEYYELAGMTELSDKTIMMYGRDCLATNDLGTFEPLYDNYITTYSIVFRKINAVFEDREKIVWLATDNGLYNTMDVTNASRHLILSHRVFSTSNITSVFEMPNHDIWLGTWGRGIVKRTLDLWNESSLQLDERHQKDGNYTMVWSFCRQGSTDNVWIGCQAGRLIYYNPKKALYLNPKPFDGRTVRSITEDKEGNTWFGTQNGGLFKHLKGSSLADSSFKKVAELGGRNVEIKLNSEGQLWICVLGKGVMIINPKTGQIIRKLVRSPQLDLSSNTINTTLQANDSIYYIGSDALDILNIKTGAVKHVSHWRDIPLGEVLTFQTDSKGQLWLSTNNGIFQYQPTTGNIIRYTQWDGLITPSSSNYITTASYKLHNGELAFGGSQNLVIFDSKKIVTASKPPDVSIASFRLFGQFLPVDSLLSQPSISLSREQNSISIEFAALSFRQLDKLVYYYKLEGADKDWIRTDHRLMASYNLLPPGKYTFLVKAQNAVGDFSKNVTKINIQIRPPFWRTWWFYTLSVIAISLAAYSLHRFRINKLLQVEKVRLRLARDLHDDMGSTLSTIHILSNMAMRKMDTDAATSKDYIGKISANSARIMEAMDDIVWSINPLNDSMKKIIARMKEFAGNVLESKDIDYAFNIEETVKDLSFNMEWRREIFLLFKEAINNIAKYSQCSKVDITMQLKSRHLVLRIEDNGIGFDTKQPVAENRGNGVRNMQKRAESMNGRFTITSCKGQGTCVEVKIPVT
jgi:signal transduction histidine kinase/ligand-binding sensor domain-containing protein